MIKRQFNFGNFNEIGMQSLLSFSSILYIYYKEGFFYSEDDGSKGNSNVYDAWKAIGFSFFFEEFLK